MPSSADVSRRIYQELGPDGLAARTTPQWDADTVTLVASLLQPGDRILDLGCGYGRIAVPLAHAGFDVTGLDISPSMLDAARAGAGSAGVQVQWLEGDLCRTGLPEASYDVVLCLWMTFHELLEQREQLAALTEMCRLMKHGGWGLLDGHPYHDISDQTKRDEEVSFQQLLPLAGIDRFELFVDDCPGRPRPFARFFKPGGMG